MVREVTVTELQALRAAGQAPLILDVREIWELQLASLSGVLHIPMNEIPARLGELDENADIVVMCKAGGRSMQVARFLEARGFRSVANLTGGINAWSREVDPTVAVY